MSQGFITEVPGIREDRGVRWTLGLRHSFHVGPPVACFLPATSSRALALRGEASSSAEQDGHPGYAISPS